VISPMRSVIFESGPPPCANTMDSPDHFGRVRRPTMATQEDSTAKPCTRCGAVKSLEDFSRDARTADGRNAACKACKNAANAVWRQTPRGREIKRILGRDYLERHRESERARGREKYQRTKDAYIRRQRVAVKSEKGLARASVRNALYDGRLVKPDRCSRCQAVEPPHRIHAHHTDYSRRRDVQWLCSVCHGKEHRA
jgi:hypothetical protein